ncbi:MAG: type II toxin-antitoxin system VapC family toxin [Acidobacteria bacterium]|nr:type II toxin-antitoxin system VapC family toxin [Acidobacteriota bacterium]
MKLLIDSCTFLWIASGSSRLSKSAAQLFMDADNERYLSSASAWEIAIKSSLGRLPLPARAASYIPKIREQSGVASLPVDEEAALLAANLPDLHADPFDRMLIAQAILHGMTILSPDSVFEKYPVRTIW